MSAHALARDRSVPEDDVYEGQRGGRNGTTEDGEVEKWRSAPFDSELVL